MNARVKPVHDGWIKKKTLWLRPQVPINRAKKVSPEFDDLINGIIYIQFTPLLLDNFSILQVIIVCL
ncbi:MAG: hypothetical protein QF605_10215, partial [Rhodospirillales bacterium]|nr:hypothetical protein [Rhodospirillales bacterium]